MKFLSEHLDVSQVDKGFYSQVKDKLFKLYQTDKQRTAEKKYAQELLAEGSAAELQSINFEASATKTNFLKKDSLPSIRQAAVVAGQKSPEFLTPNQTTSGPQFRSTSNQLFQGQQPTRQGSLASLQPYGQPMNTNIKSKDRSAMLSRNSLGKSSNLGAQKTTEASQDMLSTAYGSNSNKYLKMKAFSWVRVGDTFTLPAASNRGPPATPKSTVYGPRTGKQLAPPQTLQMMASNQSFYGGFRGNNAQSGSSLNEDSLLWVQKPYLLENQSEFYKNDRYARLPPPENKEKTHPIKREHIQAIKEKLKPFKNFVELHSKGFENLESEDFIKHLERCYKPLLRHSKHVVKHLAEPMTYRDADQNRADR